MAVNRAGAPNAGGQRPEGEQRESTVRWTAEVRPLKLPPICKSVSAVVQATGHT